MQNKIDWRKYVFALVITSAVFFTALFVSNYFNERRIETIRNIEDRISIDILSLETQFDLLEELSCDEITENSALSKELNVLERRLSYTEAQLGTDNEEVLRLKQSYSLLQIKDYLLMKKISEKCGLNPIFILYFYSNEGDCEDCVRMGHVLTFLRDQYPKLRVYSFDYNLDLSVLDTLITINNIKAELPAFVIDNEVYYGFHGREEMEEIIPSLDTLREETATSTEESA